MIIKCFRCEKEIDTPKNSNADYIMASDTIVKEPRETPFALQENEVTKEKKKKMKETKTAIDPETGEEITILKYSGLKIEDSDFTEIEISDFEKSKKLPNVKKVITRIEDKDIQKTAIICPKCYKKSDFVIWGVHKKKGV